MNVKDLTLAHVKSHLQASSTSWSIIFTCMHSCICMLLSQQNIFLCTLLYIASWPLKNKRKYSVASDQVHLVIFFP
jgi:hypothetical protein